MNKICELVPNELVCIADIDKPELKELLWVGSIETVEDKVYVELGRLVPTLEIPKRRVFLKDRDVYELHELDNTTKYLCLCLIDDYTGQPPVELYLTELEILFCTSSILMLRVDKLHEVSPGDERNKCHWLRAEVDVINKLIAKAQWLYATGEVEKLVYKYHPEMKL